MKKLIGLLLFMSFACSVNAGPTPDFPFITMTGEAKNEVEPDKVTISFEVVTYSEQPDAALKELNDRGSEFIALLEKYDVEKNEILSYGLDKYIKRAREKNGYQELEILGYEYRQPFRVTLNSLEHYSDITDALMNLENLKGVNSTFDVSNRDELEAQLVKVAAQDARIKASNLADGMGVKLDSIFAVNQDSSFPTFFATFGLEQDRRVYADSLRKARSNMFVPKTIQLTKKVNVIYKISQ